LRIHFTYEYTFDKFGFGGGQIIALNFIEELTKLGHEVTISCSGKDNGNIPPTISNKFYFSNFYSPVFSSIYAAIHSRKIIKIIRPDLVCSFTGESFYIAFYCKSNKIKFCNYIAAPTLPIFTLKQPFLLIKNIRNNLTHFFQFVGVKQTKMNFTISNYTSLQLLQNWSINEKHIKTLGCGVSSFSSNIDCFKDIDIISVGRIEFNQKPINITAKSLSLYQKWQKWIIIGSGHDSQVLLDQINAYGFINKVEIYGTLNNFEVSQFFNKSKISILLSTKESFLITAYESILARNILIVSDVAQISYDFEKFNSIFILKKNTPEEIIQILEYIENNYNKIYESTLLAREYVLNNYSWDKVSKKLISNIE
jgi:glycosyltransferase involved in cell wall biosynthesis